MKVQKNVILNVKYIFLNFLQALFSEHYQFKWDGDITKTQIVIADRHAIDLGVAAKRPSIIMQRGEIGWTNTVRGQDGTNAGSFNGRGLMPLIGYDPEISDRNSVKHYTDLLRGYMVFNVISKNGIQAEIIADHLFKNFTGYKESLRKAGIQQISNLTISQEQIIKSNSEIELVGVQVSFGFIMQLHIIRDEKTYNCFVYNGDTEELEQHDYQVIENGTKIKFRSAPTETPVKIDYTDAITLESRTGVELLPTSDDTIYLIPSGGSVAGFYKLLADMIVEQTLIES